MLLGIAVALIGILLAIWGVYNIINVSKTQKGISNLLDILINGGGSGFGMTIFGLIFTIVGVVLMFS